jgi:hypothetical protein
MSGEAAVKVLSGLRVAVGALAWLAPDLAAKAFGLDFKRNKQAAYVGRLFGIRDIALGIGTSAAHGENRRGWLIAGVVCDVADAAAAEVGRREGHLDDETAIKGAAAALGGVLIGAFALRKPTPPLP